MKGRILFVKQDSHHLYYADKFPVKPSTTQPLIPTLNLVKDYFSLNLSVIDLYKFWSSKDSHFNKMVAFPSQYPVKLEDAVEDTKPLISDLENTDVKPQVLNTLGHFDQDNFHGIRILHQDPWENLVSFICSSNNNIKRISQMVDNLCTHFGNHLGTYNDVEYYDFPTPLQLSGPNTETKLRDLGFGYRAKYIHTTAQMVANAQNLLDLELIDATMLAKSKNSKKKKEPEDLSGMSDETCDKGLSYLASLRQLPYEKAHLALLQFSGVGPKVADCVCLMSLEKHDCVPVDTHVWQIAQRDYKFRKGSGSKKGKDLQPTKTDYDAVATFFKDLWGEYAGWAHTVLFAADLKDLNNGVNSVDGSEVKKGSKSTGVKKEKVKKEEVVKKIKVETIVKKRKVEMTELKEEADRDTDSKPVSKREERLRKRIRNLI